MPADSRAAGIVSQRQALESEYGPRVVDRKIAITHQGTALTGNSSTAEAAGAVAAPADAGYVQQAEYADPLQALYADVNMAAAAGLPEVSVPVSTLLGGGSSYNGPLSPEMFPTTDWQQFGTELVDLGPFVLSAYDPCIECCGKTDGITASGTKGQMGRTVAVDPNYIPYGSLLLIGGYVFIAEDSGEKITGNHIDLFMSDHATATLFGMKQGNIYLIR